MNKRKIKYLSAVAVFLIATAFGGCKGSEDDIIALDEVNLDDDSQLKESLYEEGSTESAASPKEVDEKTKSDIDDEILCVYVCGAVDNPGVYNLSGDIRMIDAIKAAGGMKEDAGAKYLNLASKVTDGQKIYVPTTVEVEEAFAQGEDATYSIVEISADGVAFGDDIESGTDSTDEQGRINLNTADKTELMTLPGIGESKADKIIEYRDKNGGFSSTEDLMLISGIKEGLYNKVKDKIFVK